MAHFDLTIQGQKSFRCLEGFILQLSLQKRNIMDVFEAIKGRRSVRKYKSRSVERELIEKLLSAACWAPSGENIQSWNFIVVEDRTIREMVRKISPGYFGEAPLARALLPDTGLIIRAWS
jgi:nitroreductase